MERYDAIIIGGGHNGLVCGAYLARAGKKVCVLEKADVLGGCATTESLFPSRPEFRSNRGAIDLINIQGTPILNDLELAKYGLELIYHDPLWYFPFPDGSAITAYKDMDRTVESIASISPEDAESYRQFNAMWESILTLMSPFDYTPPPSFAELGSMVANSGQNADVMLRILLSPPRELIRFWFKSPHMQGIMAWMAAQTGTPPDQPASALALTLLLVSHLNGMARPVGGTGRLSEVIGTMIEAHGGKVSVNAEVKRVLLDGSGRKVRGVDVDGEVLEAPIVVSAIDARRLFTRLIETPVLDTLAHKRVSLAHADYPTLLKVDLALSGTPELRTTGGKEGIVASINIAPSMEYVERAWNDYGRGAMSGRPPLMCAVPSALDRTLAPGDGQVLWLSQFVPPKPAGGTWDDVKEQWADEMVETFIEYAPNTRDLILERAITTPLDRERITGNINGNPFHLDMTLDQSWSFRPTPELSKYETPVEGLFLTGSGTYPGGGVTGIPGYNAAHIILAREGKPRQSLSVMGQLRNGFAMYKAWRRLQQMT